MKPFPKNHWLELQNQKVFLDGIAKKYDLKTPSDWGKVSWKQVNEVGGAGLLSRYGGSLFGAVKAGKA